MLRQDQSRQLVIKMVPSDIAASYRICLQSYPLVKNLEERQLMQLGVPYNSCPMMSHLASTQNSEREESYKGQKKRTMQQTPHYQQSSLFSNEMGLFP